MGGFPHTLKNSQPLRVLVVEDERLIRWAIGETLALAGHTVIEAENGAIAVRALSDPEKPFDAVLLDYQLPDSNDLRLLASIRRLSPHTPVILMTAYGAPDITKGALDLGVCGVMNKPFEMHDLEGVLVRACGSGSQ
jgi:DNA-binding NtrC family response regulator